MAVGGNKSANWWAAISALVAAIACVIAGLGLREAGEANAVAEAANRAADEANAIAREGLDLARRNEERLNRAHADGVYLGEAPAAASGAHPLPEDVRIWFAVYNSTTRPIENVWVADEQDKSIKIEGIQPCTFYALEAGFRPVDLYFSDAAGLYWHRAYNALPEQLTEEEFPPLPERDTGGDSPWLAPVEDCSG